MSFIPPGEHILETRVCPISHEEFVITEEDRRMYDMLSPIVGGQKLAIPFPILAPEERQIRRMMWRNYDQFYKNTCALTGKEVIATYRPGTPYKVCTLEAWWSDDWNPESFGKKIDFSRPFFDQFHELDQSVYHMPLSVSKSENSAYTNFSVNNRNCYLCSRIAECEDCYYSLLIVKCKNCFDNYNISDSEYLYECIRVTKSYHCLYCTDCENCENSYFLKDSVGCRDCFGSCNLKNARFVFNNIQLSESEYTKKLHHALSNLQDPTAMRKNFLHFCEKFPKRYITGFHNENVFGNFLFSNTDVIYGFDCNNNEKLRHAYGTIHGHYCMDTSFGYFCEMSFEACGIASGYGILFSVNCIDNCRNLLYCKDCVNGTNDSFGCISLKKGKHCILNTAYSQNEYEGLAVKLVDHMIQTKEWGEFFPSQYSPYSYNESAAYVHYPHDKAWAAKRSFEWYEAEKDKQESGGFYPLSIDKYDEKKVGYDIAQKNIDSLLLSTLYCVETGKPYRIIGPELAFYIENSLSIPLRHPTVRANSRMQQTLPVALYNRACDECQSPFFTPYAPERPEKILCETCYQKLIY